MVEAQRRTIMLVAMAVALAAVLFLSFALTSSSQAHADARCPLSDFRNPDGSLDTTAYLACVQGTGSTSGNLPRTGSSDTGQLVGLGAALVVLGGAAVYGSRRFRTAEIPTDEGF